MMDTFKDSLDFYAQHHRLAITKITHFIGVPMVILAVQIFLSSFHYFNLSLAWIALILLFLYYLFLNRRLAIMAGFFLFLLTDAASYLSLTPTHANLIIIGSSLFAGGWMLQFAGHYFEGKPPAFFKNILQVFIAPLFLCAELYAFVFLQS